MKVMIIAEGNLETGRGPLFRRLGSLPGLARRCELSCVCLAEPDGSVRHRLREYGVPYSVRPATLNGWDVVNLDALVRQILTDVRRQGPDLVVLDWEIWDLMRELSAALPRFGTRFATIVHAVPFLNTPAHPSGDFMDDVSRRLRQEADPGIRAYIRRHAAEAPSVLDRLGVLVPNACARDYLNSYFPGLPICLMEPGYALDLAEVDAAEPDGPPVDFAFMARLVREKGTEQLLEIFAEISTYAGFEGARMLIVSSFAEEMERHRFTNIAAKLDVLERLELTGWCPGTAKYQSLKRAAVFLYPALESDTFAICILEALACGLPTVCWNVPFSRATYRTDAVTRCSPRDRSAFAQAAVELASQKSARRSASAAARQFVRQYGSWDAVAHAEAKGYEELLRGCPSTVPCG